MIEYALCNGNFTNDLSGVASKYGICAFEKNDNTVKILDTIGFTDEIEVAKKLVQTLNEERIPVVHFKDIVEDTLYTLKKHSFETEKKIIG